MRRWLQPRRAVIAAALVALLGGVFPGAPSLVAAQESYGAECPPDQGQRGVYLYDLPEFQGKCSYFTGDGPNADRWHIGNDAAQSLRIVGALMAVLWTDQIFGGVGTAFINEGQIANLDLYPCPAAACVRNKQATSLMVRFIPPDGPQSGIVDVTAGFPQPPSAADPSRAASPTSPGNGLPPTASGECHGYGVFLFDDREYAGRCQRIGPDTPDWFLRTAANWSVGNDSVSSLRIRAEPGQAYRVQLFEGEEYTGRALEIVATVLDLPDLRVAPGITQGGWLGEDWISSAQVSAIVLAPAQAIATIIVVR